MIVYGITMQEKAHELPEEVAVWLLEQNARYPLIDFKIDYTDYASPEAEDLRKKYSRTWRGNPTNFKGVDGINFHFLKETWTIRVIGGCDTEGNIADMSIARDSDDPHRSVDALGSKLRTEISTMPPLADLEQIEDELYGFPRKEGEPVQERATALVSVPADMHWESGLAISADELYDLFHGQPSESKAAIMRAMSDKDWDKAKQLLNKQRH